ncbi:MAG: polysaccharide deacetylase family protein [Chloroflexota bacterium]|nr:MAG: polysaccharide deacetylase family protein [Chloroflexota bacterium]
MPSRLGLYLIACTVAALLWSALMLGCETPRRLSDVAQVSVEPSPMPTAVTAVIATPVPTRTRTPTAVATATSMPGPERRPELVRGDPSRPLVALTFNIGGTSSDHVDQVLSVLREKKVPSSFFLVGLWTADNPELTRRIAADGHEIGSHSFAHIDYPELSDKEIAADLTRGEETFRAIIGRTVKPLFRFPSGARDDRSMQIVMREGYRSTYWTVDSGDWRAEMSGSDVYQRVMKYTENGSIVVMHANSLSAAQSLGAIIDSLRAKGLGFVKVTEMPE